MSPDPGSTAGSSALIALQFDADLDPATVTEASFTLTASGGDHTFADGNEVPVQGTVSYDPATQTATFTPAGTPAGLLGGDTYQVWLDGATITDLDGDLLDGEYNDPLPSGDGAPGGEFLATFKVNVPQVSGNYTTNVTWAAGTWYLYNDITVYGGATLTLLPGVVAKGRYHDDRYNDDNDMASELRISGTLSAQGTEEFPIYFTSIKDDWHGGDTNGDGSSSMPSGRDWGGIRLYGGSSGSVLEHVEVLYAGCNNIDHNAYYGITVSDGGKPTIRHSRIASGGMAAIYMALHADPDLSNLTISGYSINGAELESGSITTDMAWDDPDVTYYMQNDVSVASGATLTISPDMVIKGRYSDDTYNDDNDLASELRVSGTLIAQGTEEMPIVFTSIWDDAHGGDTNNDGNSTGPGGRQWGGIRLYGGSSASVLQHTELLYAGSDNVDRRAYYGITVSNGATPTITHSRIASGGQAAIYMGLLANPVLSDLSIGGYSINGVQLQTGTITSDVAWDDPDVVYYMDNDISVPVDVTLTIAPGMVVKGRYRDDRYNDDNDLSTELRVSGTLDAAGTVEAPIVFTSIWDDWHGGDTNNDGNSSTPGRGGWGGLRIWASSSDTSIMEHVEVWYGGRDNIDARSTDAVIFASSSPTFKAGAVMYSLEDGIVMSDDECDCRIENTLFAYNSGTSIKATSNSSGEFVNNTFNANGGGILCDSTDWSVVRNNIFSNHSSTGVLFQSGALGQVEYNLFWDNATHTSGITPSPVGIDGNVVGDPLYRDLSVHDFRLRDGSAAIDAGTSIGAPSLDQLGNMRYDDPNVANTGFGVFAYYDIGAYERQAPSRPIDLVVEQVLTLPTSSINDPLPVQYTVRNVGENPALGTWTDAIFLSQDEAWDPGDLFMGSLTHHGGLEPGGTYNEGLAVSVPGALEGDYDIIVYTDYGDDLRSHVVEVDEENNWLPSDPIALTIPELRLGAAMAGQFQGDDAAKYYKVVVSEGMTLEVEFDDANDIGSNELYLRYETIPTRIEYEARGSNPFFADQEARLGGNPAGTYYLMAFADSAPDAPAVYEVTATTLGFGVEGVTPDHVGNSEHAVIVIEGSGFAADPTVVLRRTGQDDVTTKWQVVADARVIQATFDLSAADAGLYDVVVIQGGVEHLAMQGFRVEEARPAELELEVTGPRFVRRGRVATITTTVTNTGNATIPLSSVRVIAPPECRFEDVPLVMPEWANAGYETITIDPSSSHSGGNRVTYLTAADLGPGESASFDVRLRNVSGGSHQQLPVFCESAVYDEGAFFDLYRAGMNETVRPYILAHPDEFQSEDVLLAQDEAAWNASVADSFKDIQTNNRRHGDVADEYVDAVSATCVMVGWFLIGTGLMVTPVTGPGGIFIASVGAFVAEFGMQLHHAKTLAHILESITAWDPNDKVGPGYGEQGYVQPNQTMPYTIHFENVAAASAPAQEIVITDQLHANLDWTTFELTQIGFGEQVVDVPAGHAYYQTEVGLGDGLIARVEAGLDIETGLLSTHLVCLDRTTGLFPEDPLAGLLPPNVNPPEGEGWLSFRVAQQPGLADGDVITNQATIVFDVNPPIDTNVVTNTIDDTPPTSTVDPLPAEVTARFEVSWAGDDGDGSGVQSYTIYRAVDGGPFEVWLRNTVETSAMFDGEWGQSYAFCAVARDRAGNREDDPIDGESFTAVQSSSQLRVASLETTPSGLVAYFREPLDAGGLSLYDTAAGTLGPADFTVVGETVGPVAGSLVYDEDAMTVAFIKTGGPLLPDTYSVTLRSAIDGFKASDGRLLDGDGDDVEGGDYVATLTVDPDAAPVISLPDFARGPGQPVDVPATEVGLPIRISDAAGVESVDLTLRYDPARLTITGATVGPEMPSGSMVNVNVTMPGRAVLSVISPAVPDAGEMTLANLIAEVPADAGYGRAQILDLGDVRVNEGGIRAVADDAIHVAAYLGDTNGNGSYGSLDVKGALHAAVGLDGGFPAYPSIDPVVVADVTGNGALSTLDATRILQEVIGLDPAEIPPLPGGGSLETLGVRSAGLLLGPPDAPSSYRVSIPTDLEGAAGQIVTVPIAVEEAEDVEVFDMTVGYDASLLAFEGERVSDLGSIWAVNSGRPGLLVIGVGNPHPLPAGGGTVIELDFVVDASVTPGEGTAVDLESVSLNEGALPLDPTPVDGVDPTDGRITFVQPAFRTLYWNPSGNGIWANDSQWLDGDGNQASDYPDDESTDAVVRTNTVSVVTDCTAHDLTVESGAVEISADAALTLTGDLDVQPLAQYVCQLDGSENGLVEAAGSATLEGTLSLQPTECSGLLPADQWGHQTRTILTAEGGLNGDFANFPDGQPLAENIHLGKGVFLRKGTEAVTYGDTAVEVHLLQAAPGDANGDGQVDMDDIWGIVSAGEYDQGPGPDVDWTVGDFDCNGRVDFDDIWSIVQSGRYDQGPYAATIAEVVAAGASAVDAAPAHDAVFEQVAGRASARHRAVPGKLAWLSDFGQTGARRRPSRRARPMEQAGENMLARCWR